MKLNQPIVNYIPQYKDNHEKWLTFFKDGAIPQYYYFDTLKEALSFAKSTQCYYTRIIEETIIRKIIS